MALLVVGAIAELDDADDIRKEEAIRTVVKACKPWDDDSGASYPEAAELVDFKDSWVGNRVREWKRGDFELKSSSRIESEVVGQSQAKLGWSA